MIIKGFDNYDLEGSFVYFIFSKDLLYIGETQKITFSRWVQHFYKKGTFSKKVHIHGNSDIDYFSKINLLSIELKAIREHFPEIRWKAMSQAVEHSLHEHLSITKSKLLENYYDKYEPGIDLFKIVSDTSKTAPRSISKGDWDYARKYASEILDKLYNYL